MGRSKPQPEILQPHKQFGFERTALMLVFHLLKSLKHRGEQKDVLCSCLL